MDQRQSHTEETQVINTTIGELIEAITDIAKKAGKSEEEGYRLASMAIEKLSREQNRRGNLTQ